MTKTERMALDMLSNDNKVEDFMYVTQAELEKLKQSSDGVFSAMEDYKNLFGVRIYEDEVGVWEPLVSEKLKTIYTVILVEDS